MALLGERDGVLLAGLPTAVAFSRTRRLAEHHMPTLTTDQARNVAVDSGRPAIVRAHFDPAITLRPLLKYKSPRVAPSGVSETSAASTPPSVKPRIAWARAFLVPCEVCSPSPFLSLAGWANQSARGTRQ